MGNVHSADRIVYHTQSEIQIDEKSLSFVRTKHDPRFGEIDELQHNESKERIFRKEVIIDNPELKTDLHLLGLKNRVNQRHTNLLQTYGFIIETGELDSNEISKISVYFEHFATDASVEFRARKKSQNFFLDDELLGSLLYCLHVLHFLQGKEINHGNMAPSSILMGSDGEIKLADHSLLNKDHSLYRQIIKGIQTPYVAPELLPLIRNKEEPHSSKFNPYKADVFSLGMTFLYAALLNEPLECYDWETLTFNGAHLFDMFEKVREKYPGPFANILHSLLKIDPKDRADFLDLVENIEYHKNNDYYVRDPRYAHPAPKIVVSGADFVSKHLRSPRAQGRGTPQEKVPDYYTPIKRDTSPHTSYIYNTREQADHSRSEFKLPNNLVLKSLPSNTQSALAYNFVDPKVQAIIRESREKTAQKSQLTSPYASKILLPTEYAATIKPNYQILPNSADTRYTPSTYSAISNTSLTINPSAPLRPNAYQNILGQSGIHSPSSYTQELHSLDQFNPRFNNPFVEANPYPLKSFETPANPQQKETDKYSLAVRELLKKQPYPYEEQSKAYSSAFSGVKISEPDTSKKSEVFSDDQFYLKYGISAPKPTENVIKPTENVVNTTDDNKLSFNNSKVNELISQIRARNYSPGPSIEHSYPVNVTGIEHNYPVTVTSYEKSYGLSAPANYSPLVHHTGIQSTPVTTNSKEGTNQNLIAELKKKYLEEEKSLYRHSAPKPEEEYKFEGNSKVQLGPESQKDDKHGTDIRTDLDASKWQDIRAATQGIVKSVMPTIVTEEKSKKQEKPVTPKSEGGTEDIVRELRQRKATDKPEVMQ